MGENYCAGVNRFISYHGKGREAWLEVIHAHKSQRFSPEKSQLWLFVQPLKLTCVFFSDKQLLFCHYNNPDFAICSLSHQVLPALALSLHPRIFPSFH